MYRYSHNATISVGQILPISAANVCQLLPTSKRLHFAEPSPPSAANCPLPPGETADTDMAMDMAMVKTLVPTGTLSIVSLRTP